MTPSLDEELVLLTSYFNLADGRRQDTSDTFRVDPSVSSGTSPDGTAALYVVTEASTGGSIGPRARRVAADTVAWEYSAHADDPPPARLKAALRAAHEAIAGEFDGHVTVGLSAVAIEGETVYLGQVAPAQVYVVHESRLSSLPAVTDDTSPFARALGSRSGPRISVFRDQIGPDDVLALVSSWYHRGVDEDDLRGCFAPGSADDIAESLMHLGKQHDARDITAIVIEAVPSSELQDEEDGEAPPSLGEQVDLAFRALSDVGRMLWDELRAVPPIPERNGTASPNGMHEDSGSATPSPVSEGGADPGSTYTPYRTDEQPGEQGRVAPTQSPWTGGHHDMTMEVPVISPEPESDTSAAGGARPVASPRDGLTEEIPVISPIPVPPPIDDFEFSPRGPNGDSPFDADTSEFSTSSQLDPVSNGVPEQVEAEPKQTRIPRWKRPQRRRRAHPISRPQGRDEPEPEEPSVEHQEQQAELEAVNSRILASEQDLGGDVIPPVQAFADTNTVEPSRIYATSKDIEAVNRRPRRFSGARPLETLGGPRVIRPGDPGIDLRKPVARSTPPALIWLSAIVMLILVLAASYLYINHRRHAVAADPYPALARSDIARALTARDLTTQATYLQRARTRIASARQFGETTAVVADLQKRLSTAGDRIYKVSRVTAPTVLENFAQIQNANPSEIATLPGTVFVLDRGRNSVFAIPATGATTNGPSEIARAGEFVSSVTVGTPIHLTADNAAPGTLLILDDKNQLVRYTGSAKTATTLAQPTQTPMKPDAIATSDPDVYLLDRANNQVWRYPLAVTNYNPPPGPYFDVVKPSLQNAISIVLDGSDLWALNANGSILRYDYQEHPVAFQIHGLPTPLNAPTSLYTASGSNYLWIADPRNKRIVELDKSGNYIRSYESGAPTLQLGKLRGMTVGPAGNTMYALAGSELFSFPISR